MEIILKTDIAGLGYKNDVVTVKPGYGRNYLIPQGFAVMATDSNKKQLAEMIAAKHANVQTVPLSVGVERGLVKLEVGLGRGQKKYDKRQVIKARQTLRDMAREIKHKK